MRWPPLRERLLSRLIIDQESGCLLWTGYIGTEGYGVIGDSGKLRAARCAAKTSCNYGHPFDEANTFIDSEGFRRCRICFRAGKRAARQRRKDADQ